MTKKKKSTVSLTEASPSETTVPDSLDQLLAIMLPKIPETQLVSLHLIDLDPKNRKHFKERGLAELAENIKLNGVLQDILLQPKPDGRFKMIAGERRYRASGMAGLKDIPAKICDVPDAEARRLRFAENAFRENLHPMEEAELVSEMLVDYGTVEEVAARIGKTKGYVYGRMRLNDLIDPIQEMFLEDIFTIQQALDIAILSAESQQDFFSEYCCNWKEEEDFTLYHLEDTLDQYRYSLENAPFDTTDPALLEGVVACTACPHNSAVVLSFFPESEPNSTCLKTECFNRKCNANFILKLRTAYEETKPQALVFYGQPTRVMELRLESLPDAAKLPRFSYYSVKTCAEPVKPIVTDFPKFWEGQTEPSTDEEAYAAALESYEAKIAAFQADVLEGKILTGLLVRESEIAPIIFHKEVPTVQSVYSRSVPTAAVVTNKAMVEAVKDGSATAEMIDNHEETCKRRESRNQELDREKVFAKIHDLFKQMMKTGKDAKPAGPADVATAHFFIYSQLYGEQQTTVLKKLFPKKKVSELKFNAIYQKFATMDSELVAWMVRQAILRHNMAANPGDLTSEFLYQVAAGAGIDVSSIEKGQVTIAKKRQKNLKKKLAGLHSLKNRLAA